MTHVTFMHKALAALALSGALATPALAQEPGLANCGGIWFSTEEDFFARSGAPGGSIISDGDLLTFELGSGSRLCARNQELMRPFDIEKFDHGLDALHKIELGEGRVHAAFSTEIDSVNGAGQFTAGDLLTTTGLVIPNQALLAKFGLPRSLNLGLDAVTIDGSPREVSELLAKLESTTAEDLRRQPDILAQILEGTNTDILFSTEATPPNVQSPMFLDGDLLSARTGTVVRKQNDLLPGLPSGLSSKGVDYGLDAYTPAFDSIENVPVELLSIEIQAKERSISDGDMLQAGPGVYFSSMQLINSFEPLDSDMGLDALAASPGRTARCGLRITTLSRVDVASALDPATGLFDNNFPLDGIRDYAFGGAIEILGELPGTQCEEHNTHEFQVQFSLDGGSIWGALQHPATLNWMSATPACPGLGTPYTETAGWIPITQYQRAVDCGWIHASLGIWRSNADVPGDVRDAQLRVVMRPLAGGAETASASVPLRIDNKRPEDLTLALYRTGEAMPFDNQCQIDGESAAVVLDIKGNFFDDHYRTYALSWSTNGGLGGSIPVGLSRGYGSRAGLTETGTMPRLPPPHFDLETAFSLPVLIDCGYQIRMTVYDRTRIGRMNFPHNGFSTTDAGNHNTTWQNFCLKT